jgi:hypothetical protein
MKNFLMRIAHINNTSGIASIIAKLQTKHGQQADVFVFNRKIFKQFGGIKYFYKSPIDRWKLFRKLGDYDIWHYHYPYGSLKNNLEKRNKGKIYLKHYHGDDIRGKYDEDYCLVSTPDLLQYVPNGKWLPNPIDIDEIESVPQNQHINRITKVAHYPHYKMYHSNDYYTDALVKLQREMKCETVRILHFSHIQTLEIIAKCDIVIGKILPNVGWFGKFELEAMALGKPVIAYVSNELYEKYKPPLYRTTKDTFRQDLESLLEDNTEKDRLSTEGPKYVKKYHSMENTVESVQKSYEVTSINAQK